MLLKKCSACARAIRDTAITCDYCGYPAEPPVSIGDLDTREGQQLLFPIGESREPEPAGGEYSRVASALSRKAAGGIALPAEAQSEADELFPVSEHGLPPPGTPNVRAVDSQRPRWQLIAGGLAVIGIAGVVVAMLGVRGAASPKAATTPPADARVQPGAPHRTSAPAPAAVAAAGPTWSTANSSTWVGNSRQSAAFELFATNKVQAWLKEIHPRLVVRCLANVTDVFVFTETAAKMERQDSDHTVRIRFDDQPEVVERWPDSAEHDALFAPDGEAFVHRLLRARSLQFSYTPHNASPVVAAFAVAGLDELSKPIARQCRWKP
jgi:hypothetical protein